MLAFSPDLQPPAFMTRVWEFQDDKAMPSDLVLEQDFILRVRRMQRLGTTHTVVNLVLNAIDPLAKSRRALEAVQQSLQEIAKVTNAVYAEMSNGDVFLIWEKIADAGRLIAQLVDVMLPEESKGEDTSKFVLTYSMPGDYTQLRERANHYVEVVRAAASMMAEGVPAEALKSEAARGPLTAWSADQIGRLLNEIDLRRYSRTQPIYRHEAGGKWAPVCEEYFVSIEDLRRERFPKLEIITPEHLFLALCETLDQRLLTSLAENPQTIAGRHFHLNLSVAAVMSATFARFAHGIPREQRSLIGFELHRGDLLQDFARTLGAIETLKDEGFKVALDSITPDMANYINLAAFDVDYIKINVSRDRAEQLNDPAIRKSLAQIPAERLIFFRCDNERALAAGLELGVSLFQGWLIDDAVQGKQGR
jgi:EAL domain-containing protein (putative c-di-GMP-specific phosphodiesterase class I)